MRFFFEKLMCYSYLKFLFAMFLNFLQLVFVFVKNTNWYLPKWLKEPKIFWEFLQILRRWDNGKFLEFPTISISSWKMQM